MSEFANTYTSIREYLKSGKNEEQTLEYVKELYRQYLQKLTWGIQKQDVEFVRGETDNFEYIRSIFEKYLKEKATEMDIAYQIGIAIGESRVGDAWVRDQQDDITFAYNMTILLSKAHIKEILIGIYNCPGIQHKTLAFQTDIKANYLNQLATALEKARCIRRFGNGKCTYYELTLKGRDYVREHLVVKKDSDRRVDYFKDRSKFDMKPAEQRENLFKQREEKVEHRSMDKYNAKNNVINFLEYAKSWELLEN